MPRVVTNTTYESFFWVEWNQVSQDIPGNKTKINWACGVSCGHSFLVNAIRMSDVYINGVLVHREKTYSNFSKGNHTIESGTMDISHGANGQKTFYISRFTGWLYSNYNYTAEASTHNLPNIPRGAGLTGAVDFKDTENPTITYSNPAGNSVTALEACISLTGATDDVKYRSIPETGTSYTFPLDDTERALLRRNTAGTSRKVHFYLRTKIGSSTFHSSLEKTFTVTENDDTKPSVIIETSLNNELIPSKFDGLYIQGKSRVNVTLDVAGKYGAGIQSYYASMEGKIYSSPAFTSDVVQNPGNVDIVGYARDTRGFSGKAKQSITVIEYSKPLVVPVGSDNGILCYRSDGNGVRVGASTSVWIKAKRSYHSVSGKNTCALQWRRKLATEQWNDGHLWNNLLSNEVTANEYNALISGTFDLDKSYTIQVRVIDDIGEQDIKTLDIPTRDVALHLGKGGRNVSVGSYCDYTEPYTFHSEWDCIFDKDVRIAGDLLLGDRKMTLKDYILNVINEGG